MIINTNISQWIAASEPDFFMMFIKAWIPFNAWYMKNYYSEDDKRTSDRDIMDYMKGAKPGNEPYKDRIVKLLRGSTTEAVSFQNYLAALHFELRAHPIPNVDEAISFCQVCIISEKPDDYAPIAIDEFTYTARQDILLPKNSPRWMLEVIDTAAKETVYMVKIHKPSLHELVQNDEFIALPLDKQREGLKQALNMVSPNRTDNLVLKEYQGEVKDLPTDSYLIGETKKVCLVDNKDKIARAVIQILYELRCKLFHGELAPTSDYKKVYEYAFYLQRMLIKNLV